MDTEMIDLAEFFRDAATFVFFAAGIFIPLELAWPQRPRVWRGRATDIAFATFGFLCTQLILVTVVGSLVAALDAISLDEPPWASDHDLVNYWLDIILGLSLFEIGGYVYHRAAHRFRWLWRFHAVHHSAEHMDWLAGFRQHPFEVAMMTMMQNAPLVVLGVPLATHAGLILGLRLQTLWLHSNVALGSVFGVKYLLATPAFHQRHHARFGPARNFSTLFPWLDRLLGTYCAETGDQFGVEMKRPQGFIELLLEPCRPGIAHEPETTDLALVLAEQADRNESPRINPGQALWPLPARHPRFAHARADRAGTSGSRHRGLRAFRR
jgi:sterol desaturase/sphingolipid hydroxylase (fatty acid hydroxylase superfamily)